MLLWKRRPLFGIQRVPSLTTLVAALLFLSACGGGGVSATSNGGSVGTDPSNTPPGSGYALAVEIDGSGSVTSTPGGINCADTGGSCDAIYSSGTNVILVAAPAEDYDFSGWDSSGLSCASDASCTASMVSMRQVRAIFTRKRHTLNLSVSGYGTVTSAPAGIVCGSDCTESYASGTSVTLTAAAAAGYTFAGWSGSGISCPGTGSCTVPMTAARNVAATFSPATATNYLLQVSVSGAGSVGSAPAGISCGTDCSESYASGTSVTLTATPATGYTFGGWNGAGCSGTGSCTVSMTAARTTTATFTANTYPLSLSVSGSGSVNSNPAGISCGADCSESYDSGTAVTLTATPASGYTFSGWSGSGCAGTGNCTVSMTAARSVSATFTAMNTLTVTVSGSGAVSSSPTGINCGADCSENYTSGTSVTLTATSSSGAVFSGWSGACTGTGACTVAMTSARNVTATFTARYALNVSVSGSGTVTSSPSGISCGTDCSENYNSGTSVTLTATPANGYVFGGWGGACTGVSTCTVSMTAARNATASFTANTVAGLYQVAWDAVSDARVNAYRIYYSTTPLTSIGSAASISVGNVTSYTFNPAAAGLSVGTTVYFGVTASADGLESPLSETVSVVLQ